MTVEERGADDPVVGHRYWQVTSDGSLRSLSQRRFVWEPRVALRAVCVTGGHRAPHPRCGCGIYGATDLASLCARPLCPTPGVLVAGEVDLWGAVVTEGDAHRAARAYPRRLAVVRETVDGGPERTVEQLATYGVPVEVTALDAVTGEVSARLLANQMMAQRVAPVAQAAER